MVMGLLKKHSKQLVDKLNLNNKVIFKGLVNSNNVKLALQSSDIFLQHSITALNGDQEGFGVSIAEASATGLPVICSNATGIRDQVVDGKTGFLVPEKDVKSMAEKMLLLANDYDLRKRMGTTGRNRMIDHYDTTKQIEKLENVLLNLI